MKTFIKCVCLYAFIFGTSLLADDLVKIEITNDKDILLAARVGAIQDYGNFEEFSARLNHIRETGGSLADFTPDENKIIAEISLMSRLYCRTKDKSLFPFDYRLKIENEMPDIAKKYLANLNLIKGDISKNLTGAGAIGLVAASAAIFTIHTSIADPSWMTNVPFALFKCGAPLFCAGVALATCVYQGHNLKNELTRVNSLIKAIQPPYLAFSSLQCSGRENEISENAREIGYQSNTITPWVPRTISQSEATELGGTDCAICLGELAEGEWVTQIPCGHGFHSRCILDWFQVSATDSCPKCRKDVGPVDIYEIKVID